MIRKAMTIGVLAWMLIMNPSAKAAGSEIQLIVNSANPANTISKHQTQRIFMKKEIRWDHGVKIAPVDLGPEDPVRQLFSNDFLGKNLSAVKSYWQQMAFSGRATPPIEYEREIDVIVNDEESIAIDVLVPNQRCDRLTTLVHEGAGHGKDGTRVTDSQGGNVRPNAEACTLEPDIR